MGNDQYQKQDFFPSFPQRCGKGFNQKYRGVRCYIYYFPQHMYIGIEYTYVYTYKTKIEKLWEMQKNEVTYLNHTVISYHKVVGNQDIVFYITVPKRA